MASVETNDGTRKRVVTSPDAAPSIAPTMMQRGTINKPNEARYSEAITVIIFAIDCADRSIPPM